ncbi:MAG: acyltransferase [Oscillospiraceae bacterium]|nr:acyltransferase [Oscillospiraceae bacterium]
MERKRELDYMNAAACLLVILIHVLSTGIVKPGKSILKAVIYLPWKFSAFVVPLFIYTAAVKVAQRYGGQKITGKIYLNYCLNRIKKIYIPYVLWCAVYCAYRLHEGQAVGTIGELFWDVLIGKLSSQFYFVVIIMQFYLTMPLWVRMLERVPAILGIGVSLFVSLCMAPAPTFLSYYNIAFPYKDRFFLTYCIYWAAGLYAGKYYDRLIPVLRERRTLLYSGTAAAVHCVLSYVIYINEFYVPGLSGVEIVVDLLSILLLHAVCLGLRPGFVTTTLQKICGASFSVYLSHCLFLMMTESYLYSHGVTRLSWTLPVRAAVCYTVPFLLYWVLSKLRGVFRQRRISKT